MATSSAPFIQERSTKRLTSRAGRQVSTHKRPRSPQAEARVRSHATAGHAAAQSYPERDELAVKLLPLVKRLAFEMRERLPQHVEVDDLAGAGALGLLDAVRKFDARKHVKIETYARHRIRGAILDSLREMDTASRDMRRKNKYAEKVYQRLQGELGRAVTDQEMAEALGITLRKWYRTVNELNSMGVEWMRPNQIPETNVVDEKNLPAQGHDSNPYELCYRNEQRDILARAAATLPEKERTVLTLYYEGELTMKQIGERMGVDESRISQIHSCAMSRLRNKVKRIVHPAASPVPSAFMLQQPTSELPAAGYY